MTRFIVTEGETEVFDGVVKSISYIRAFIKQNGENGKIYTIKRVLKDGTVKTAGYCAFGSELIYKSLWRAGLCHFNYYVWESGRLFSKKDGAGRWRSHDWVTDSDNDFMNGAVPEE